MIKRQSNNLDLEVHYTKVKDNKTLLTYAPKLTSQGLGSRKLA